jgi:hypothetical protein
MTEVRAGKEECYFVVMQELAGPNKGKATWTDFGNKGRLSEWWRTSFDNGKPKSARFEVLAEGLTKDRAQNLCLSINLG